MVDDVHLAVRTVLTSPAALFVGKVGIGAEGPDVQGGAVVNLSRSYRCHPDILAWPSYCFYSSSLVSALPQPSADRPERVAAPPKARQEDAASRQRVTAERESRREDAERTQREGPSSSPGAWSRHQVQLMSGD